VVPSFASQYTQDPCISQRFERLGIDTCLYCTAVPDVVRSQIDPSGSRLITPSPKSIVPLVGPKNYHIMFSTCCNKLVLFDDKYGQVWKQCRWVPSLPNTIHQVQQWGMRVLIQALFHLWSTWACILRVHDC